MSTEATALPAGRPIRGPSAFAGDAHRFLHLTWTLAVMNFRLRFFGSMLGYVWQLMRPLLLFAVLYVVFTEFVRFGGDAAFFPVVLLSSLMLFYFLAESVNAAVTSVLDQENLVRKIEFPRLVIPLSVVLTAFFNLLVNLVAVGIFMAISQVPVQATWVELPLILGALVILATGFSMLLSALFVRFRDVQPIWEVVLQAAFYASPIIYPLEVVPEQFQRLIMCNPLAVVIQQFRHAIIDPTAPSAADAIGGWGYMLIPAGITVGVFVFGLWVFNREARRIAELL